MTANPVFKLVLSDLFKQMGIDAQKAVSSDNSVYTVQVDEKFEIHLVGEQEGFLHLWCSPCDLPASANNALLLTLLNANAITFAYPHLNVGVQRGSQKIVLWTRQALTELDSSKVTILFAAFMEQAEALQQWITQGGYLDDETTTSNPMPENPHNFA